MIWTKEKPKTTGWYWVRAFKDDAEIVLVANRHSLGYKDLMVCGTQDEMESIETFSPHCQWYGPITPPEDL